MASTIQARLDHESEELLRRLTRKTGWSPSQIVREGLRLLASCHAGKGKRALIGQGKFASGAGDLASNKAHLKGFGQ